jgi:hypothetical protein
VIHRRRRSPHGQTTCASPSQRNVVTTHAIGRLSVRAALGWELVGALVGSGGLSQAFVHVSSDGTIRQVAGEPTLGSSVLDSRVSG